MLSLHYLLLLLAFLAEGAAAVGVQSAKVNLIALGLALYFLTLLLAR